MARTNFEWVAQVSLLRPGCSGRFDEAARRTADPSTSLRFGRDDKGRAVTFRKARDLDGQSSERLLCEDYRYLHFSTLGMKREEESSWLELLDGCTR